MKRIIIIIFIVILSSCSSKQNVLKGTFYNQQDIFTAFVFNEKGEYNLLKKYGTDIDTISKGTYINDKGYVTLNTVDERNLEFYAEIDDYFNSSLKEIKIEINSPFIKKINELGIDNTVYYTVNIDLQEGSFYEVSKKNVITLVKPYESEIKSIKISIKLDFFGLLDEKKNTKIITESLYPQNIDSNVFQISIPDVTVSELNKIWLTNEVIKIEKEKGFQWLGAPFLFSEDLWNR
jgi:hypothetical protein